MKLKSNIIKVLSVFLALFLIAETVVHANDTPTIDNTGSTGTTVGGEPQISAVPLTQADIPPNKGQSKTYDGDNLHGSILTVTNKGDGNVRADALIPVTPAIEENGQVIPPNVNDLRHGTEVTAENTKIYNENLQNFYKDAKQALMKCVEKSFVQIDGQWYIKSGFEGNMNDAAKISKTFEMAQFLKERLGTMDDKI